MKTITFSALLASLSLCACNVPFGLPNSTLTQHLNSGTMPALFAKNDIRNIHISCHSDDGHAPYKVTLEVEDLYGVRSMQTADTCEQPGEKIVIAPTFGGSEKFSVRTDAKISPELMDRYLAYLPLMEQQKKSF